MSYPTNKLSVLAVLQHTLQYPQLNFSDITTFRQQMAVGFESYSSVFNVLYLSAQAATPGMAFLAGYQNAIRCLDPTCPNDELAAFCVSEKGIKKPREMTTRLSLSDDTYRLDGKKSHVMLLPDNLDRMYVVAKNEVDQLCCLYLSANSLGVLQGGKLNAPFVEDIPHSSVSYEDVLIAAEQLLSIDGHKQANKPFRYWEDIHVALAMMAWMLRELLENGWSLSELDDMVKLICQLIEKFESNIDYYSLDILSLLDKSYFLMDEYASNLLENSKKIWAKDKLLLQMGKNFRDLIHKKLCV